MEIQLKNNTLRLLHQKAIYWVEQQTLLLSDLHIGKISHFRKAGIAVPQQALYQNFQVLDQIMAQHEVKRVVCIGDLFHSDINKEWERFCDWRHQYQHIEMCVVLGNHDKLPKSCYQDAILATHTELMIPPFVFAHHPRDQFETDEYVISGHVHPVIRLSGKANQHLKFPCFYFGSQQAILPSFGYFTGGYAIQPVKGDRVIAVVENTLIAIS